MPSAKRSKNQLRRERLKQRKLETADLSCLTHATSAPKLEVEPDLTPREPALVAETPADVAADPLYDQFRDVFDKWGQSEHPDNQPTQVKIASPTTSDDESEPEERHVPVKRTKVPLAALKSSTIRPQVVEWHDQDARDPVFLVALKSVPNAIPVPDHWSAKRDYLANRKGFEKPPFQLPHFIQETGIQEMRNSDADKTLKQQQRDRVQPKMGRLDLDYRKLHRAFFERQSRPRLFTFGDVYYEGRELSDVHSDAVNHIKPGHVSKELRQALGILTSERTQPPWITLMSSLGKPPAYKDLIIPGIDVSYSNSGYRDTVEPPAAGHDLWGHLEAGDESEEEEEEEKEEEEEEEENADQEAVTADEPAEPVVVATPIEEYSLHPIKSSPSNSTNSSRPAASGQLLYTVVDETTVESGNKVLSSRKGYNISSRQTEASKPDSTEVKLRKKFKF